MGMTDETHRAETSSLPAWPHGQVMTAAEAPGFTPPGSTGFVLRPIATTDEGTPAMLLGTLEPQGVIPREIHPEAREHLLLLEGQVTYRADDGTSITLQPGQVGRLEPNTWHTVENSGTMLSRFVVCLA